MIDSGRCQLPLICHTKIEQQQKERKARFGKIIFSEKSLPVEIIFEERLSRKFGRMI
jgi:hypothetical protein